MGELFRNARIEKGYRAEVLGNMTAQAGRPIDRPLDGKAARTRVVEVRFDPDRSVSVVRLQIDTGRRHQIRRHLDAVGHPVMGDPRYGRGNKNRDGLKLVAERLSFTCPLSGEPVVVRVPDAAPGPGPAGEAGGDAPPEAAHPNRTGP
jgi:tRNA pseudouridine32 synthase/23S rRNA pseudouridine746 synthase